MTYQVQLLFYAVVLITPSTSILDLQKPSNVISNFLQNFIGPYLRSAKSLDNSTNNTETDQKDNGLSKIIKRKMAELKPHLQDNDEFPETDNKLTLRGNNETTLIEFLPRVIKDNEKNNRSNMSKFKDPLEVSIHKYKKLRAKIKTLLDEETITEKTKTLIIATLDEMIARMIESQCTWSADRRPLHSSNDTSRLISKVNSMSKKEWKKLKHKYLNYLKNRKEKENLFIEQFNQFFSSVIQDTDDLSNRYKVHCELVEIAEDKKKATLREKKNNERNVCEHFKVCSGELREFFYDYFHYLNETAVSVFKNYAAMYVRDVNNDYGINKDVVIELINNLGNNAGQRVYYIYKSELKKMYLDPLKERKANIKQINNFIKTTISNIKVALKGELVTELSMMRAKLFLTVKEDLLVNLEVDFDNLERHYLDSVCATFMLCNGRLPSGRRMEGPWTFRPKANNEIFVKVQLSFDEEMKKAVEDTGLLPFLKKSNHLKFKAVRNINHIPRAYNLAPVNITRTTLLASIQTKQVSTETTEKHIQRYDKHKKHNKHKKWSTTKSDVTIPVIVNVTETYLSSVLDYPNEHKVREHTSHSHLYNLPPVNITRSTLLASNVTKLVSMKTAEKHIERYNKYKPNKNARKWFKTKSDVIVPIFVDATDSSVLDYPNESQVVVT